MAFLLALHASVSIHTQAHTQRKKYIRHFLRTNILKQNVTFFFLPSPPDTSRVMGFWLFAYLLVQITFRIGALNHNGFSLPCYTVLTIHVLLMSISSIHFCISCMTGKHTNKSFLLHSSQVLTSLVWGRQSSMELKEILLSPHNLHGGDSPGWKS